MTNKESKEQNLEDSEADKETELVAPHSSQSDDDESDLEGVVPTEVADMLKEIPKEDRKQVTKMLLMSSRSGVVQKSSPIAEKIEPRHIDKIIDSYDKESERESEKFRREEVTKRIGMGGILGLILMVLIYAGITGDRELSEKVIFAGIGGLGGYGVGVATSKKATS